MLSKRVFNLFVIISIISTMLISFTVSANVGDNVLSLVVPSEVYANQEFTVPVIISDIDSFYFNSIKSYSIHIVYDPLYVTPILKTDNTPDIDFPEFPGNEAVTIKDTEVLINSVSKRQINIVADTIDLATTSTPLTLATLKFKAGVLSGTFNLDLTDDCEVMDASAQAPFVFNISNINTPTTLKSITISTLVPSGNTNIDWEIKNDDIFINSVTPIVSYIQYSTFTYTLKNYGAIVSNYNGGTLTDNGYYDLTVTATADGLPPVSVQRKFYIEVFETPLMSAIETSYKSGRNGDTVDVSVDIKGFSYIVVGTPYVKLDVKYDKDKFKYVTSTAGINLPQVSYLTITDKPIDGIVSIVYDTNNLSDFTDNIVWDTKIATLKFEVIASPSVTESAVFDIVNPVASRYNSVTIPDFFDVAKDNTSATYQILTGTAIKYPRLKVRTAGLDTAFGYFYKEGSTRNEWAGVKIADGESYGTFRVLQVNMDNTGASDGYTYTIMCDATLYNPMQTVTHAVITGVGPLTSQGKYKLYVEAVNNSDPSDIQQSAETYTITIGYAQSINSDSKFSLADLTMWRMAYLDDRLKNDTFFRGGYWSGDVNGNFVNDPDDYNRMLSVVLNSVKSEDYSTYLPIFRDN